MDRLKQIKILHKLTHLHAILDKVTLALRTVKRNKFQTKNHKKDPIDNVLINIYQRSLCFC